MPVSRRFTTVLLWLFLLAPFLSYVTYGVLGLSQIMTYYRPLCLAVLVVFLLESSYKAKIPLAAYFLLLFFLFRLVWIAYYSEGTTELLKFALKSDELAFAAILILINNLRLPDRFLRQTAYAMKGVVIVTAGVSIWQAIDPDFMNVWVLRFESQTDLSRVLGGTFNHRRASIYGYVDNNALGLSFIPLYSVLLGTMLNAGDRKWPIYFVLVGAVSILSNARYVMVGFLIISLQIAIVSGFSFKGIFRYTVMLVLALVLIISVLPLLGYDVSGWIANRLLVEDDITQSTRFQAVGNFLTFFPESPILGTGKLTDEIRDASNAVGSSHIHVGYLSHLVYYGVAGCFFLFGSWCFIWASLRRTAVKTGYYGSILAFGMFWWSFATMSESSMLSGGLVFALVFDNYYKRRVDV